MLEKVEDAVRVTQNNDACVAETLAAARLVFLTNLFKKPNRFIQHVIISKVSGAFHFARP